MTAREKLHWIPPPSANDAAALAGAAIGTAMQTSRYSPSAERYPNDGGGTFSNIMNITPDKSDERLAHIEKRLDATDSRLDDLKDKLGRIESKLDGFSTKADLQESMHSMTKWMVGTAMALGAAAITVMTFVLNNAAPKPPTPPSSAPIVITLPAAVQTPAAPAQAPAAPQKP